MEFNGGLATETQVITDYDPLLYIRIITSITTPTARERERERAREKLN